jgi:hypothetical protein
MDVKYLDILTRVEAFRRWKFRQGNDSAEPLMVAKLYSETCFKRYLFCFQQFVARFASNSLKRYGKGDKYFLKNSIRVSKHAEFDAKLKNPVKKLQGSSLKKVINKKRRKNQFSIFMNFQNFFG